MLAARARSRGNSTAPSTTIKVGLYPVTANGGADDKNDVTLGTVVSEVSFSGIAVNSRNFLGGADFAFPADGYYVLGVTTVGTLADHSLVDVEADLQVRNTA